MKIHVPGIGTQYVDEDPPAPEPVQVAGGISVEDAIKLAQARAGFVPVARQETEVLSFTRGVQKESPLVDNSVVGVVSADNVSAQLEHGAVPVEAPVVEQPAPEPAKVADPLAEFGFDPLTQ